MIMTSLKAKDADITTAIQHHWNNRAAKFDDDPCHGLHSSAQRDAWVEILARLAGNSALSVLDVGCGTGFLALLFAELGHSVTGIDLSPEMLSVARQKAEQRHLNLRLRVENGAAVQDGDATYDLVIARHVIWVLPDPAAGTQEWLRVLRPGGRLALIEGKWGPEENTSTAADGLKNIVAGVLNAGSKTIQSIFGKTRLSTLLADKVNNWKYHQLQSQLPFSGGPSAEKLVAFLETQGLKDLTVEPLMNPVLWGDGPQYPRYLVVGRRS
jgi:2-polyprenyl-3-methyl-5-hydroxy-6-metoxy-1,4-benzoquinol methylase